jgi:hypothetical protein
MAGIGAAMQPQPGDAPQPGPAGKLRRRQDGDEPQPNVSPEEQAQYDEFVQNGMKLVYQGDHVAPAVLDQLNGKWDDVKASLGEIPQEEKPLDPSNPIDNLAVATVALVLALEASAANAGKKLDPGVVFHGGVELLEQLADIAQAANIHDFTQDEMDAAGNRTAMLYGVSSKSMDKQEALAEFDHFLKTQGDQLGQSMQELAGGQPQDGQPPQDQQQQQHRQNREPKAWEALAAPLVASSWASARGWRSSRSSTTRRRATTSRLAARSRWRTCARRTRRRRSRRNTTSPTATRAGARRASSATRREENAQTFSQQKTLKSIDFSNTKTLKAWSTRTTSPRVRRTMRANSTTI